jgi:hypothetical protein
VPNAIDRTQLPLYRHLERLLNDDTFLIQGGYAGFYTTHFYPHTVSSATTVDTLKGLDMAVWQAFQAHGCGVYIRPVLETDWSYLDEEVVRPHTILRAQGYADAMEEIHDARGWVNMVHQWRQKGCRWADVVWLNEPQTLEGSWRQPQTTKQSPLQPQLSYTAYGNEGCAHMAYSVCAIIISVPPYRDGARMTSEKPVLQ